jgi:hypothetical protein
VGSFTVAAGDLRLVGSARFYRIPWLAKQTSGPASPRLLARWRRRVDK